jgi:hypothetical protein
MPCVTKCRRPVTKVCSTTSISSQIPSMARLPHQAHTVTLSGKSCRVGARGPGAPAAASETRAGSLMIGGIFAHAFTTVKARDRLALRWHPAAPFPQPMLARSGALPTRGDWAFELKWDGFRGLLRTGGAFLCAKPARLGHDPADSGARRDLRLRVVAG